MEFEHKDDGTLLARLIFETTETPKQEDVQVIAAYRENGQLKRVEIPKLTDISLSFIILEEYLDYEISVYVWDKNMKPLMEVQKVNKL